MIAEAIFYLVSALFGRRRLSITPTMDASPMPENENVPNSITAPPIPMVRMSDEIMRFLVELISTFACIMLLIPTDAIVPNKRSIIPPRTACGIV